MRESVVSSGENPPRGEVWPKGPGEAPPEAVPLFFSQRRIWFLEQLETEVPQFHLCHAVRLRGFLDLEAFEQALNRVVARHEMLRTTFHVLDGNPVQVTAPARPLRLAVTDLRVDPAAAGPDAWLHSQVAARFDLSGDLPLRAAALVISGNETIVSIVAHAIACDDQSFALVLRDLSRFYNALVEKRPLEDAPAPPSFTEYCARRGDSCTPGVIDRHLDYWGRCLQGAPPVLQLPLDRPRPPRQSHAGNTIARLLPPQLAGAVTAFAARHSVEPSAVLLAALKVLLHRYTGERDLMVGAVISIRTAEVRDTVGPFYSTLPLRTDLSDNPGFTDLLLRLRQIASEAAHHAAPFEEIVRRLHPQRTMEAMPLFQVLYRYEPREDGAFRFSGTLAEDVYVPAPGTEFDLTFAIRHSPSRLLCEAEFSTDLFDAATIHRFLGHYATLLESALADPGAPVSQLQLLGAEERTGILHGWNDTARDYPLHVSLHHLFEDSVEKHADSLAFVGQGERLTYRELNRRANRLAHYLGSLGMMPGTLVAFCLERTSDLVATLLGILKAGCAYVPLDPDFPPSRLSMILEDSRPALIITQESLRHLAGEQPPGRTILLDRERGVIDGFPADNPRVEVSPDSVAYVLFTSGSTGRPKGVQIEHRNIVNFLLSMRERPGFTGQDGILALTTVSFDIAALEIFLPLAEGGFLHMISRDVARDPRRLADALERSGATVMQATPATWKALLHAGWQGQPGLKILCGGEAITRELAAALLTRCGELWNMYGPTETTVWSTAGVITARDLDQPLSLGRPIANTQIYILDAHRQPVPPGVPGEIYIGGMGVARGYLGRPDLNAERFLPDPFTASCGGRMYRTGDLGRFRPGGNIDFLGRADFQVKVRGFRIELGDIEAALRAHPAVRDAAVIARRDAAGDSYLVGCFVPAWWPAPPSSEIRRFLGDSLPWYMIPSAFSALESFPLTPNGKVDRNALASAEPPSDAETPRPEPQTPTERELQRIWERLLKRPNVGVDDNFFDIGGHSLIAVSLFSEVERVFRQTLPLATLFQAPTIAQLAAVIDSTTARRPLPSLVPIKPTGARPPFYCVHGVGGAVLEYYDIAKHLPPEQPLYGIQARGLIRRLPTEERIEDLAAAYIAEVREFQPQGPYYLGGSSFGGLVAYEMAQQLVREGQQVALLALFDTHGPDYPKPLPSTSRAGRFLRRQWLRVQLHAGNLWLLEGAGRWGYIRDRWGKLKRASRHKWQAAVHAVRERLAMRSLPALRQVRESGTRAQKVYVPSCYNGKVVLFRAASQPTGIYEDRTNGFGALCEVEIIDVPGHHGDIVRNPRARYLTRKLVEALDAAHVRG